MTRGVRDRILKDVNGNISDHLRNHIHLTNCIHLKNHMHKHSPIVGDRALMRDLVVLQRSRSLKDPSASPPSWQSPSAVDTLLKRGERDGLVTGRRSVGIDRHKEDSRISGNSPTGNGPPISKAPTGQLSDRSGKDAIHQRQRVKREEPSVRSMGNDAMWWNSDRQQDGNDQVPGSISGNSGLREKFVKKTEECRQDRHLKTHSGQLKDVLDESDDAASSRNHDTGRHSAVGKIAEEAGRNTRSQGNNLHRARRRRFRGARRNRPSVAALDAETQNEMSVASNSYAHGRGPRRYQEDDAFQDFDDQHVSGVPRNGCGIPWNWSRIHHRGKTILDKAGRSLSCGLSESRLRRGGSLSRDMAVMSEHSSSFTKSDAEAPLLFEASGSQGSVDHAAWHHDYSGELGLYADNLLKQEMDSDLASEGRSREQHKFRKQRNDRHQNLTQKYMPRSFRDLVGQNLVVQALSNAIMRRKVGLLYVFHGAHGTGKTSCARLFARALNCQSLEHPKPCGFCKFCIAYDMGKSQHIKEIGPVGNIDSESIIGVFNHIVASNHQSQYKVFIFDECDTLSSDCWNAILKVIDRAPRRVVFVLVCSSLDVLPHIIISRCQKFFFPKLKDADIIYTLQWIATKEDLEIDKDALKLIASRSDGSLRDAEMTLEQLSLLGQRISLCLVQELVGVISDEKLVDLLDLALSADTVNTVKSLRDIMESGVEPLALMSQLATVITDILAGSYDFMKGRPRRKFFRQQALSKQDMEKLRQALKTLSEAEKQLRVSNDRITWLTAALLQLAPDQQYILPGSSADDSLNHSPLVLYSSGLRERPRKSNAERPSFQAANPGGVYHNASLKSTGMDRTGHGGGGVNSQQLYESSNDKNYLPGNIHGGIEEIWLDVLEKIPVNSIKEFMYREGKLNSLSYGAAPTVQLLFTSELTKSKAEKMKSYILQAFESVLKSPVAIEIRCESRNVGASPILLPASQGPSQMEAYGKPITSHNDNRRAQHRDASSTGANRDEIIELEASPREHKGDNADLKRRVVETAIVRGATATQKTSGATSFANGKRLGDRNPSLSIVRSKVSLAHVIQHAEGCSQHSGWSKRKAVSIAEKLEQENLRLEARSGRLLCWNPPKVARRKLARLKIRGRKPQALLKFVSCGRCLSSRSPR